MKTKLNHNESVHDFVPGRVLRFKTSRGGLDKIAPKMMDIKLPRIRRSPECGV